MRQFDWVQKQAEKHRKLEELRTIIDSALKKNDDFLTESLIRTTLLVIRQHHGDDAYWQTVDQFQLQQPYALH